jgi:hypothetical protein
MLVYLGAFGYWFHILCVEGGIERREEQEEVLFTHYTHERPHTAWTYSHINYRFFEKEREIFQSSIRQICKSLREKRKSGNNYATD